MCTAFYAVCVVLLLLFCLPLPLLQPLGILSPRVCGGGNTTATSEAYTSSIQVTTKSDPLLFLMAFDFQDGGQYDMLLNVTLTVPQPDADAGRTMLYLIVCNATARAYLDRMTSDVYPQTVGIVPACAMRDRTLGDLCDSYPLPDAAPDDPLHYHVLQHIAYVFPTEHGAGGHRSFYLDACETVGGDHGTLRSCLNQPGAVTDDGQQPCFDCPFHDALTGASTSSSSSAKCTVPPAMPPLLSVSSQMTLCDALTRYPTVLLPFYGAWTALWWASYLLWTHHIQAIASRAVVTVPNIMVPVPGWQVGAAAFMCLYAGVDKNEGAEWLALFVDHIAVWMCVDTVILHAKGRDITREISSVERDRVNWGSYVWAVLHTVFKYREFQHNAGPDTMFYLNLALWAVALVAVWVNAMETIRMLQRVLAALRQTALLNPEATPAHTKLVLFRRFLAFMTTYILLTFLNRALSLLYVHSLDRLLWTDVALMVDELLKFAMCAAIGYTFRCRPFHYPVARTATQTPKASVVPAMLKTSATKLVFVHPDRTRVFGTRCRRRHHPASGNSRESQQALVQRAVDDTELLALFQTLAPGPRRANRIVPSRS